MFLTAGAAQAGPNPETLSRLMQAKPSAPTIRLSPVREAALRASARTLGTQTGLIERAQEISDEVSTRKVAMEKSFRFGDLVIGAGVLPPVVLHTDNAAAVNQDTLRLAGSIYEIKQPARFFSGAPSWRDWLLMGLPASSDMPDLPTNDQLLPRDDNERAFWQAQIKDAYLSGRAQAQEIFDHNLSMLEEVYNGMRVFYDLHQRNMVTTPIIAKSQEIITNDDPNTIVVGDTLFRLTMPSQFQTDPSKWKALQARPSVNQPLPTVAGYDPEQVKEAFETYKIQQARRQAEKEAESRGVKRTRAEIAPIVPAAPGVATPAPPPVQTHATAVIASPVGQYAPQAPVATPAYGHQQYAQPPGQSGTIAPKGEIRYRVTYANQNAPVVPSVPVPAAPPVKRLMIESSRPLFTISSH